ncbi:MAG TPA: tetratricopeptide repeat protein [Ktedonosporobacter sp.]|nr:tetratricopeptide repeat protein [Ktedonosporobacter sp.]
MKQEEQPASPSLLPASLGQRLRRHRIRLALSQEALADAIGASVRSVRRWEQDLAIPHEVSRARLCQLFSIDPQRLLGSAPAEEMQQPAITEPLWYVPFSRNPCFTGREQIFHMLHTRLSNLQPGALSRVSVLTGLGGIGKTQVAIEYVYRYIRAYSAIFWVAAETSESLMTSLRQIANQLDLPERQTAEQSKLLAAVRQWLATHTDWLLIGDNVEDPELFQSVLPSRLQGALLLTTRRQTLGSMAEPVALPLMSPEESVELLLRRARRLNSSPPGTLISCCTQQEASAAAELVALLEGLPLALDQAGAYIDETGCSLADYLQRCNAQRKDLLARRGIHGGSHPASVTTTLSLSVERIEREHPAAADLLRLCAFLHPEAIPEELLLRAASSGLALDQALADPYQFDLALAALRNASLVTRHTETHSISVHRLVQAVLQDQMQPVEIRLWSERAVRVVNASFPEGTFRTLVQCERFVPHALACLPLIDLLGSALPETSELLYKLGCHLVDFGLFEKAEPLLLQAVALGEQYYGPEYLLLIPRLLKQAEAFSRQAKFQKTETFLQRALTLAEHHQEAARLYLAETLSDLGTLYRDLGKYTVAESFCQRALSIQEQEPQTRQSDLIMGLIINELANLYQDQGKYQEAEPLYQQGLRICEQHIGLENPWTAIVFNNLATLYTKQRKYELAEQFSLRALRVWEQKLSPEHIWTAVTLNTLATLYRDQGKYELAEPLYQRALRMREQQLPSDHPNTAITLYDLATLYRNQGKYELAEPLYQRALRMQERLLGPDHPRTAITLRDLTTLYKTQAKRDNFC